MHTRQSTHTTRYRSPLVTDTQPAVPLERLSGRLDSAVTNVTAVTNTMTDVTDVAFMTAVSPALARQPTAWVPGGGRAG